MLGPVLQALVQTWFSQINAQYQDPQARHQQVQAQRESEARAMRLQAQRANAVGGVNANEDPEGLDERGRRALKPGDEGFRWVLDSLMRDDLGRGGAGREHIYACVCVCVW